MMKLAVNAVSIAPGGALAVLLGYLKAWHEIGTKFEITVYASRKPVIDALRTAHPHIRVSPFAFEMSPARHFFLQQFALGKRVERDGADAVWTSPFMVGRCRVPQLVHHQNLLQLMYTSPAPRLRHLSMYQTIEAAKDCASRRALRKSACNVFISHYLREQAERIAPESAPRNHVIYNGLDSEVLDASEEIAGSWKGEPHLSAIQSSAAHKDNPTLLRTLVELVHFEPSVDWTLSIAGGGRLALIQKMAAQLGIAHRIRFTGYLSHHELALILRKSVCLVYPSLVEAFGLPPIQAMAQGCPPVACRTTALPEIIGDAGILVEPGRPEQFAAAISKLYHDKDLRQSLVERGLKRVQQFRWSDSAARLAGLLKNLSV